MKPKPVSEIRKISRFLDDMKKEAWLGSARRWWPDYLFHFTDIEKAISILKVGALLSRNETQARGLMATDNASPLIIGNTADEWTDYARLYFRPRTPTQYSNEGFRPPQQWYHQSAHCSMPIQFIFDSKAVLRRSDVHFTDGNLAANPNVLSTAADLEQIPFKSVYHDAAFHMSERNKIVFHKNAEVIVPNQLDLGALRYIVCRSQAEYETFLYLLPQNVLMRWRDRIRIDNNRMPVFWKRWTYVESADLSSSRITLRFNESSKTPGPFQADAYITDTISRKEFSWQNASYTASKPLNLSLDSIGPLWDYSVRLTLDGQIAFAGRYQDNSLPW